MPLDLVGKLHKTIIVEGVRWDYHEDCAKFIVSRCGPMEGWDSNDDRLWVIFEKAASVETAKALEGTNYMSPDNKLAVRTADEKVRLGKSILSKMTTGATVAPRSAVVASGSSSGLGNSSAIFGSKNIAGLLGPASGASSTGNAVKEAAAQQALANKTFLAALSSKEGMQLMLGGPAGWKAGQPNPNAPSFAGGSDSNEDDTSSATRKSSANVQALLDAAEASLKADIAKNITIKTSTSNLLLTEADIAAKAAMQSLAKSTGPVLVAPSANASPLYTLGTASIPANMISSDVDDFISEHLRRQVDALLLLGGAYEAELQADIRQLKTQMGIVEEEETEKVVETSC